MMNLSMLCNKQPREHHCSDNSRDFFVRVARSTKNSDMSVIKPELRCVHRCVILRSVQLLNNLHTQLRSLHATAHPDPAHPLALCTRLVQRVPSDLLLKLPIEHSLTDPGRNTICVFTLRVVAEQTKHYLSTNCCMLKRKLHFEN